MVSGISPCGANFQSTQCGKPYICMAHTHKMHLMTPQGHLVQLALVYSQSFTFVWLKF